MAWDNTEFATKNLMLFVQNAMIQHGLSEDASGTYKKDESEKKSRAWYTDHNNIENFKTLKFVYNSAIQVLIADHSEKFPHSKQPSAFKEGSNEGGQHAY